MKTWIGISLLALRASWKWVLALFVVVVLVAAGFIVRGIILEDSEAEAAINVETSEPTKAPAATYMPKAIPTQVPKATAVSPSREDDRVAPTPVVAPTPAPTRPAATPTVAPPPSTPAAPTSVDVPINLTGASNVGSLEFVLVYDPEVLQVTGVAPGALADAAVIGSNTLDSGRVWVGIADAKGIDGSGDVAIVTFDIVGRQQGDSALTLEQVAAHDATSLVDILSDATAGEYTIKGAERDWTGSGAHTLTTTGNERTGGATTWPRPLPLLESKQSRGNPCGCPGGCGRVALAAAEWFPGRRAQDREQAPASKTVPVGGPLLMRERFAKQVPALSSFPRRRESKGKGIAV